jgi:mannose/fructose-specific phosphotransferase system component IIA
MTEPRKRIACVVVGHGSVAQCLMDAVQGILGKQSGWIAISNAGLGLKELLETLEKAVDELSASHDVVVFSDMPGGSCHHVCQEIVETRSGVRVVTGTNLMMLLEFFVKRERTSVNDLLALVRERGRDAVRII